MLTAKPKTALKPKAVKKKQISDSESEQSSSDVSFQDEFDEDNVPASKTSSKSSKGGKTVEEVLIYLQSQ